MLWGLLICTIDKTVMSGTPSSESSPASVAETKVMPKEMKSTECMEMLKYFDKLPDDARESLLEKLCTFNNSNDYKTTPKRNLEE